MLKKVTLGIAIIALLLMISVNVMATDTGNVQEITIRSNNVGTTTGNNTTNNTINNTTNNTTNNTNVSNYTNSTKLPQTGIDSSVLFIMAIFAVSAVFAYKKIKDYNN